MNTMNRLCRLIMLPGLGADHRLLEPQRAAVPDLIVPDWIPPRREEGLPEYAARFARTLDCPPPIALGGVSLGGMVAYELARHLRPRGVVLVASDRTGQGVHAFFRRMRPLASHLPAWTLRSAQWIAPWSARVLLGTTPEQRKMCTAMFADVRIDFMQWAIGAILRWSPSPLEGIPVFHIHGARDRLIPAANLQADEVIPDGGHLINLTHSGQVNRFLQEVLGRLGTAETP